MVVRKDHTGEFPRPVDEWSHVRCIQEYNTLNKLARKWITRMLVIGFWLGAIIGLFVGVHIHGR